MICPKRNSFMTIIGVGILLNIKIAHFKNLRVKKECGGGDEVLHMPIKQT